MNISEVIKLTMTLAGYTTLFSLAIKDFHQNEFIYSSLMLWSLFGIPAIIKELKDD